MCVPGSEKGERTEDQVTGYPVRRDDQAAGFDCIFDQDLVVYCIAEPCDELGIGHAPVHPCIPADIPEPPSREDAHFL